MGLTGFILRTYLNVERGCLEAFGNGVESSPSVCKRIWGAWVPALFFALNIGYYYYHVSEQGLKFQEVINIQFLIDFLTMCIFIIFPFFGPLHRALGYFDPHVDPLIFHGRLDQLSKDVGTRRTMGLVALAVIMYTWGDVTFWRTAMPDLQGVRLGVYAFLVTMNIVSFYSNCLVVVLSMRALLTRLFVVDESVEDQLRKGDSEMMSNYNTFSAEQSNHETPLNHFEEGQTDDEEMSRLVQHWTQTYRILRVDTHNLSEHFGVPMLLGLFLFTLDTTSMVTTLWEHMSDDFTPLQTRCVLSSFLANAFVLIATFFSTAFLVTECSHHIGPKLSILAARHPHLPALPALAAMFLHAPLKIHVGNFEVSTEYANGIALLFLGLFLIIFGIKLPGPE